MTSTSLFTPTPDGTAYDIQPAGVLILLASEVYENPAMHTNGRIQGHIDAMLTAARVGGFTQSDILATLLSKNEVSHRVKAMAVQACAAADHKVKPWFPESGRNFTKPMPMQCQPL